MVPPCSCPSSARACSLPPPSEPAPLRPSAPRLSLLRPILLPRALRPSVAPWRGSPRRGTVRLGCPLMAPAGRPRAQVDGTDRPSCSRVEGIDRPPRPVTAAIEHVIVKIDQCARTIEPARTCLVGGVTRRLVHRLVRSAARLANRLVGGAARRLMRCLGASTLPRSSSATVTAAATTSVSPMPPQGSSPRLPFPTKTSSRPSSSRLVLRPTLRLVLRPAHRFVHRPVRRLVRRQQQRKQLKRERLQRQWQQREQQHSTRSNRPHCRRA